ncbi:bifunctional acetate--CoA ligase family protein/GNAT family N-acetyltransferase [Legionella gresilensis]|uniref:bifunctional acetate--CoA ligase family protein/GNAT family N-acetyltransferase n=1 Tax=Legionella gresilensis TaxID=91823 RepID=UPI001041315D|nr:bifunctional acetate--CoA ligase family protein/GNAT family N-acetyltransferase [Legionella gresilensis]
MEKHYLDELFNPKAIAVVGASERPKSVGKLVLENIIKGGYVGQVFPINLKHTQIQGLKAYPSVGDLPQLIDLAIITTPALTVPKILRQCGKKGVKVVIIISAGFSETGKAGQQFEQDLKKIAQKYSIRLIGPNCLGLIRPSLKLNATFDNNNAALGKIAFISQSGAIIAAILDWAHDKNIGFSTVISLGNAVDLDFGEILDFLAWDRHTETILLYIEGIHDARQFMSGLRAASRIKPVIVVKGGRHTQGVRAAYSHTGALVGSDEVFDAALQRAGTVRVLSLEQLFSAAQVFSCPKRAQGNQLAIITNGGGAGVLAADRAAELNIGLPELNKTNLSELNEVLPKAWSHQNPIDILGDATPLRYHDAIQICTKDENVDGLLVILTPVAMTEPLEVAKQIILDNRKIKKPILVCWMGGHHIETSKNLFVKHQIPYFNTPEEAVEAFSYLAEYQHNQTLLQHLPTCRSFYSKPDIDLAKLIIKRAIDEQRFSLTTIESKTILKAFGINTVTTLTANSAEAALNAAKAIPFPIVMKINSPDITHKQDAKGVKLGITDIKSVKTVFNQMIADAKEYKPTATIFGVTIEPMLQTDNDRELIIGVIQDKVFGPAISLGMGGSLVEIIRDQAVTLPPLSVAIIKQLISKTRLPKLLGPFRNKLAANQEALIDTLLKVSEMICELPNIQEMDINPLIINDKEATVVDARILISHNEQSAKIPYYHMAICPYPSHMISHWTLHDGTKITIRPIRPEDAKLEQDFMHSLSSQSKYFRFMGHIQELSLKMLVRFTQIDYDREMALVATIEDNNIEVIIGIARYITNPDFKSCEFALVVADTWQNKGLGRHLMISLIKIAKKSNLTIMKGNILANNTNMILLVTRLGFTIEENKEDSLSKIASKLL